MNRRAEFLGRVRGLLDSPGVVFTPSERAEISHLIDHNELGEALRTMAWIIVDEKKRIPRAVFNVLRELSNGLVAEEQMPRDLASCVVDEVGE